MQFRLITHIFVYIYKYLYIHIYTYDCQVGVRHRRLTAVPPALLTHLAPLLASTTARSCPARRRRMSRLSSGMAERLRDLSRRFSLRTERYKERAMLPPTPSSGDAEGA